jgi:hypothetical protein
MVFYGGSLSGPQSPTLITDTSPDPCRSYAVHAGDAAYHDLTAEQGVQGNPVMWVDGNCCVDVPPGKLVAPDVIQAGPDGRFQYQWIYVVSAPDGLGSLGAENLENTDVSGIGDGFCENTVQPGYVIRWDVSGLLTDPARAGRVLNWLELCGARSAESETVIQPPVPTAATRSTWGQLKVRYR